MLEAGVSPRSANSPTFAPAARALAGSVVVALHISVVAVFSLGLRSSPAMVGGAPVIQITLTPRASFDGVNTPRTSQDNDTPAHAPDEPPQADPEAPRQDSPTPRRSTPAAPVSIDSHDAKAAQADPSPPSARPAERGGRIGLPSPASAPGLTAGGGAPILGAAAASTTDAYEAAVLAWIERHKRHPGGAAGIVTVRFTLDRRGGVRASEVLASSGVRTMDQAALSQLKEAAPFPRPPATAPWRTREFTVRLDFRALRPAA